MSSEFWKLEYGSPSVKEFKRSGFWEVGSYGSSSIEDVVEIKEAIEVLVVVVVETIEAAEAVNIIEAVKEVEAAVLETVVGPAVKL